MAASLWIIPFGKHKGTAIEDVPTSYLEWITEQDWFLDKFREKSELVGKELAYRNRFGERDEEEEDANWNRRNK